MSSTFCAYLWNHICARENDRVSPCCRFVGENKNFPLLQSGFDSFHNSPFFKNLRSKAIKGEPIEGCHKCYQQEASGHLSLRQLANDLEFPQELSETNIEDNIRYVELFVGHTCNLKCLTCGPDLSSSWREDYKKLGWPIEEKTRSSNKLSMIKNLNHLQEVKFVGGEPFLSSEHDEILEDLISKNPQEIKLIYFTNVTYFPKEEIIKTWKKFREVEIWCSVDGVGPINEYVRFPSKWSLIEENVDQLLKQSEIQKNLKLSFISTISLYNIWTIREIEQWLEGLEKKYPNAQFGDKLFNPVMTPVFLKISNLPQSLIEELLKNLNQHSPHQKKMIDFINHQNKGVFDQKVISYTEQLDKIRGVSVKDFVPELKELWS